MKCTKYGKYKTQSITPKHVQYELIKNIHKMTIRGILYYIIINKCIQFKSKI